MMPMTASDVATSVPTFAPIHWVSGCETPLAFDCACASTKDTMRSTASTTASTAITNRTTSRREARRASSWRWKKFMAAYRLAVDRSCGRTTKANPLPILLQLRPGPSRFLELHLRHRALLGRFDLEKLSRLEREHPRHDAV